MNVKSEGEIRANFCEIQQDEQSREIPSVTHNFCRIKRIFSVGKWT